MEQWNSGTVEQRWWNSETVMVEGLNRYGEQWNNDGGTVEQICSTVEQWNVDGGPVEQ